MVDALTRLLIGVGVATAAVGTVAVALYCTKLCPVCDHVLTKSVNCCPYCLHEFD